MAKMNKQILSCTSIKSKIKFYEGLIKDGTIKVGGSAWARLSTLRQQETLSRLSPNSNFVINKLRESNGETTKAKT